MRCLSIYIAALTAILSWLPLIRCLLDGATYEWGTSYFGHAFRGAGVGGDFWLLVVQAAVALGLVFFGLRRPGALGYALLFAWHGVNFASWLTAWLAKPEGLIFRGDTLGVEVNVGLFAVCAFAAGLTAALAAAALEFSGGRRPPVFAWTRANTVALALALALLPIQHALLRFGEPHARSDEIGVLLTMAQWVAIVFAFSLNRRRPGLID